MYNRIASNKTFSNDSFSNWQSKKCQFCMYRQLIYQQLERLKEAVQIKNKRIIQLEDFIKKISEMAFFNNNIQPTPFNSLSINTKQPLNPSINMNMINKQSAMAKNKLVKQKQNLQLISSSRKQKAKNSLLIQKKFEDPTEISFRDSYQHATKFSVKQKDQSYEQMSSRFQKIDQLKEIKKDIERKLVESQNKNKQLYSKNLYMGQNSQGFNQYDTLRTLSQPQQEGRVGSIHNISNQSSRVNELSQRKSKFDQNQNQLKFKIQGQFKNNKSCYPKRAINSEDKSSIDVIREYLKKLK